MKYPYYDYLEHNFKNASEMVVNWAAQHGIHMFDFDNCMFNEEFDSHIESHMRWIKNNYELLGIVECHPFFDTDERYIDRNNKLRTIADNLNLKYFFLTSDYNLWFNPEHNKSFFPDWYFRQRKWAVDIGYRNYQFKNNRKYNFSCGNKSNLRTEKIYNYIECYRRRRPDWYVTIYNHPHAKISDVNGANIGGLTAEQIDLWDSEIKNQIKFYQYDLEFPDIYETNPHSTLFPVHTDSYCNLVMEHTMEIAVLSEKSFKPFICEQIPVYLAYINAARAISHLGFDVFYDFIDHNQYDSLHIDNVRTFKNFTIRIDKIHELIDKLYTTEFTDFFHDNEVKKRLKYNQDYFYSNGIDKICIEHFERLLNK